MTELAVLVPVLNRPQNVKPLVESFLNGCPEDSRLVFLTSLDDLDGEFAAVSMACIANQRVSFYSREGIGTWPQKINHGIEVVDADWYLCAADDVRFVEGWWDATKELRDDERVGVIGTNDSATGGGNPRVAAGEHTCHPLVRASYVREFGTVDKLGKAVHDGYRHWYVDDELVLTAKHRNAWAFCRDAVIEHLHPYWGTADMDDTYRLGEANADADLALFKSRAHLFGVQVQ